MDPSRQFEHLDRPSMDSSFRTPHSQQREGERGIPVDMVDRVLKEGVRLPDKNRPGHHVYQWSDPKTNERYRIAYAPGPGSGVIPTVMKDPGASPEERAAAASQAKESNRAASASSHQARQNKAAQEEKQARRDWGQRFSGDFPGMEGYKAARAASKKKSGT